MTPEQIFSLANLVAAFGWIMLAVLPGRRWVTDTVTGMVLPLAFGLVYAAIVVTLFWRAPGGFSTLEGVATLFSNPWLLLAGWIHYLAFDLLIGTWETRDARERRIPHLLLVPCLFLTFMFGPLGWLVYMGLRTRYVRAQSPITAQ